MPVAMVDPVRAEQIPSLSRFQDAKYSRQSMVAQPWPWASGRSSLGAIALSILGGMGLLTGISLTSSVQAETVTASLAAQFGLTPLDLKSIRAPILPSVQPIPISRSKPVAPSRSQPVLGQACAMLVAATPARVYAFPTHLDNYGDRLALDARQQPVPNTPSLIVLHETVGSISSALHLFKRPPASGRPPVSYHTLIARDGTIIQTVPPEMRALGAADSAFQEETVQLNPKLPGSVNNFAYHISLETPSDGRDNRPRHSGYTDKQYRSLAYWTGRIMQAYGIPWERITTHKAVDRSGSRQDPRSFNWQHLQQQLTAQFSSACVPTQLNSSKARLPRPAS